MPEDEMQFNTPLRYPGGKGRLSQFVADVMSLNNLTGGHYAEPYAGGAGVALTLLYLQYASHIHLNDINKSVHAFWHSVINETDSLCRLIKDTTVSMDEWRKQRAIQDARGTSTLELGFSTFFLNRTNRSGIIRGGVIGGKEQKGDWKLDARYNVEDLVRRIEKIARHGARISLTNLDAAAFISSCVKDLPDNTLVYLDPPYFVKGQGLYENHYSGDDHAKIASIVVNDISQKWIVSYDNVKEIKELYASCRQQTFGLNYSAGSRYKGTEVMIFKDGLVTPKDIAPSRGRAA